MNTSSRPESPKPGVERSTVGLVVALYLGAALLLVYVTVQILQDISARREASPPNPAALASPPPVPLVATRLPL